MTTTIDREKVKAAVRAIKNGGSVVRESAIVDCLAAIAAIPDAPGEQIIEIDEDGKVSGAPCPSTAPGWTRNELAHALRDSHQEGGDFIRWHGWIALAAVCLSRAPGGVDLEKLDVVLCNARMALVCAPVAYATKDSTVAVMSQIERLRDELAALGAEADRG